ncbi:MAG: tetratricopeptide repeat protein [Bacteroidales bacterium]|nr:tetratricopeptide repeat protein [Bacteroidales bacterium]
MKNLGCILISGLFLTASFIGKAQNAKQYYKTGLTFIEAQNFNDAIDQFSKAVQVDPDYVEAYIERARTYQTINDIEKAAEDYDRALVFKKKNKNLFLEASTINYKMAKYDKALELVKEAIDLDSKCDEAYQLQCKILLGKEDFSGALISINKAIFLKDNAENNYYHGVVSEMMKNYNQAELDYEKALAKDRKYIDAYLSLANLRLQLNKLNQAIDHCNSVLRINPKNKDAFLIRSKVYVKMYEYPKAIDDISKVVFNNPEDPGVYILRGTYYQDFTQYQNAINDFTKAIMLDPKNSEAYYKRAYSFEQIGDYKSAIKDYTLLSTLSEDDVYARKHLDDAKKRLYELNRETNRPKIVLLEPAASEDYTVKLARNRTKLSLRGKMHDESEIISLKINDSNTNFIKNGDIYEFLTEVDVSGLDIFSIVAEDTYNNIQQITYTIERTEINPPKIAIIAPYASDDGEIFLDTDDTNLYVEGNITDESQIKSILINGVSASYMLSELNPKFSATINVANKNKFTVEATDIYGNDTLQTFVLNREGVSLLQANPMGRTWVIFVENSNYETFPSLDGPSKDVTLMRSALAKYDVHKIIHKQDMTKKEMERFFSIELRDLIRSNRVNALLIWFAGHGKFINETGYWIPVDAKRDDEFTYYNLNALRASLQSYTNFVVHMLVITDACESGPTFYQAMRETPKIRSCNDWEAVKFKSSQVFSSAGYELAVDDSQFTRTFANTLANNPDACIPIEAIVSKVQIAVSQNNQQKPKFGKISGLTDEDGTFFFISKQ